MSSTETVAVMAAIMHAARGPAGGAAKPAGREADYRTLARDAWALFEAVEQEGVERIGSMKMGRP